MVSINVPQGVGPGRFVFTALDDFVLKNNLCNIVHTTERSNDLFPLDTHTLLGQKPTQVTNSCIWVSLLVLFDNCIKWWIWDCWEWLSCDSILMHVILQSICMNIEDTCELWNADILSRPEDLSEECLRNNLLGATSLGRLFCVNYLDFWNARGLTFRMLLIMPLRSMGVNICWNCLIMGNT